MALQGSLADFGIADILQLIGTQNKTGILHVEGGDDAEEIQIFFASGRIIRCDVAQRDKRDLLGSMLVAAEAVTRDQLAQALKAQKQTLKRVGDLLVEQGALDRETLQEFTDLQTRETLFRLFEWKTGKYRFESKPPNFARAVGTPISSDTVLMEGFRILDEWPLIRAKISNYGLVFRTLKQPEDVESEAEALERILDDAFSEFVDAPPAPRKSAAGGGAGALGRNERRVLALVDGKRDVHQIVDRSRLGDFETCKSLLTLLNEGYIAPVKEKRALEAPSRRREGGLRRVVARAGINVAAVAAIVAVVLFMPRSRVEIEQNAARVASEAGGRLRANRVAAIATALEVYHVEHGRYPDALSVLVEAGLIEGALLAAPGEEPFDYLSIEIDYVLR